MSKLKLILDCDNTIINSTKAYSDVYYQLYKNHPDFVEADWTKCNNYNLSDIAPLKSKPSNIFNSKLFFELVEPFENAVDILEILSQEFDIYICTIGNKQNIQNKLTYLEKTFPFIENILPIINLDCTMDKSMIQMENAIFVDDVYSNLITSNAPIKICYGEIKSWNEKWNGRRCSDMLDMYNQLIYIAHGTNGLNEDIIS